MTYFPRYLTEYPNRNTGFPFHLSLNRLDRGYPAHRHDFLEFSYVVDGEGTESINGMRHEMIPGTFTFVLPYQVHEIFTAAGSTLVLYNCMFSMDLLMEHSEETEFEALLTGGEPSSSYTLLEGQLHEQMRSLLDGMYREYRGNERWRTPLLKAKLVEVLAGFDRNRDRRGLTREIAFPAVQLSGTMWKIIHYLHQNYREELDLTALSAKFCLSVSRISELVKQATGQSFLPFLHDLRIRHACSLLISTDMSITEIAHEVGFGSYKTFSRIFHDIKGCTPMQYRKTSRNG
ncbi:helix-turn-helix domain-containing protein [Paenibacillus tarimensis]